MVVNDASSDGSEEIAENTGLALVVNLPYNLGIGGAVQTGFKFAREKKYDIALQFDGDGQHQVIEIIKLVQAVERGKEIQVNVSCEAKAQTSGWRPIHRRQQR